MNPIRESETDRKIEQAAERFWSAFQMTENGRVKSTLLLYSFCLCWVFFGVYGVAYAFLVPAPSARNLPLDGGFDHCLSDCHAGHYER